MSTEPSPDRLEAVSRRGVPIVFVPGGIDFILYGPLESIAPEILERKYVAHNPIHTHVRANQAEMSDAGRFVAERLSQTTGPALIVIPRRGFSQLNIRGGLLFDPQADQGFIEGLTAAGKGRLAIAELEMHINEPAFAEAVSAELRSLMER